MQRTPHSTKRSRRIRRLIPYLFLGVLLIIAVFFGGIYYGRNVERANKVIEHIISLTPTAAPEQPTPTMVLTPDLTIAAIPSCNLSMLVPTTISVEESSRSAQLNRNNKRLGTISCDPDRSVFQLTGTDPDASPVATQSVTLRQLDTTVTASTAAEVTYLSFTHPDPVDTNAARIELLVSQDILSLLSQTIAPATE